MRVAHRRGGGLRPCDTRRRRPPVIVENFDGNSEKFGDNSEKTVLSHKLSEKFEGKVRDGRATR